MLNRIFSISVIILILFIFASCKGAEPILIGNPQIAKCDKDTDGDGICDSDEKVEESSDKASDSSATGDTPAPENPPSDITEPVTDTDESKSESASVDSNSNDDDDDVSNAIADVINKKLEISSFIRTCPLISEIDQFRQDFVFKYDNNTASNNYGNIECNYVAKLNDTNLSKFNNLFQILRVFKEAIFDIPLPWAPNYNNIYDWFVSLKLNFILVDGSDPVLITALHRGPLIRIWMDPNWLNNKDVNYTDWLKYPENIGGLLLLGEKLITKLAYLTNKNLESYPNEDYLKLFMYHQNHFSFTLDEINAMEEYNISLILENWR